MALTVAQRAANYYRQKYAHSPDGIPDGWQDEPPALSGPQRRRLKHKRGHQTTLAARRALRRAQRSSQRP